MSTTVMQVRMDDELKRQAAEVYDRLGLDLPTAIRMFLKRSVLVNGVPFSMTLPTEETAAALREARAILSGEAKAKRYTSARALFDELDGEEDGDGC